jgi:guanylate kinase
MGDRQLGILFVLSAPSGAGKTSIRQRLLQLMPEIVYSVSYTTRPARVTERDGRDYHFISKEQFQRMVEMGEFLEWAEVHGNRYGTAIAPLEKAVSTGLDAVLDIDVQGADQILRRYRSRDAVAGPQRPGNQPPVATIFVLPPSAEALGERLRHRASESQASLERRLQNAPQEILRFKDYDYVVVNRDLEEATRQVACIVAAERCRSRNFGSLEELLGES